MMKLTVWIVEDEPKYLEKAQRAVAALAAAENVTFDLVSSDNWHKDWDALSRTPEKLPQIVVLDLFSTGLTMEGQTFYDNLRATEHKAQRKTRLPHAYIIVWSAYPGLPGAEFAEEASQSDRYLGVLSVKAENSLRDALRECLWQIEEALSVED